MRDGAILDLNGHSVICGDPGPCLELSGAGSQLLDGTLQGGLHDKLIITGSGHTVKNVTSTPIDGNVFIDGDNNRLINVMAGSGLNAAFGIGIRGNNNEISDSIAQCSSLVFGQCIFVSGDSNRLIDNFIVFFNSLDPFQAGLTISGNYNVVRRNRIVNSDGNGIVVTGTGNDLRHNTALLNSPFDLKDTNGDCVHNTWRFNTFRTGDPACIQ